MFLGSTPIYNYSLTFAPNGNVLSANDSVNGNWNYSYDQFNRLVCASTSSNTACAFPPTGTPSFNYVYDRFGNRWQQNSPAGSIYTSSFTFTGNATNNNNRMDLYSYDSAGNLLYDNLHHYFYDAENHLIQVDGTLPFCTSNGASGSAAAACYYYDAEGRRVFRTGYTADNCDNTGKRGYVFDLAGHVIVENNNNDTGCTGQVYLGDRHFGRQGGGSFFYHSDWLGTVRLIMSDQYLTGGEQTCTSLPFGDGLTCNSNYGNVWHFTGKERDSESGLDNFGARYDSSSMGRFISPDNPKFSEKADPQTWNLYSYVSNNPLARVDLTGDNWFNINGSWQWFNGANVTNSGDPCKQGSKGCNHSDYTHLLVVQKLDEKTDKGATKVKITLYDQNKVIAQGNGFTGGTNILSVPNGNYEINLNNRGGIDTNRIVPVEGGLVLGAFHDGIQEVGDSIPYRGALYDATGEWGTLRANLSRGEGDGTQYYLHGKGLYFTEGHSYTAGCVCDPYQSVLKVIFRLDPSGVGEGDKNGRIAVSVNKPN